MLVTGLRQLLVPLLQSHASLNAIRSCATSKSRFYDTVNVQQSGDHFQIHLGKRPIRTPGRQLLHLPTLPLALAIAAEWEWQDSNKPQMHTMPLMTITATAIDQPKPRDKVISSLLKYLQTDSACCRYESGALADRQSQVFDPLLQWVHDELGITLTTSDSIYGPSQSEEAMDRARARLEGYDSWQLAAAEQVTATAKSLVVAFNMVDGNLGVRQGIEAARLEEAFQLQDWGAVEAAHDLDECDIHTRISSAWLFLKLLRMK